MELLGVLVNLFLDIPNNNYKNAPFKNSINLNVL